MRQVGDFCRLRDNGHLKAQDATEHFEIMRIYWPGALAAKWEVYCIRQSDGRQRFVREADLEPVPTYTLEELLRLS